METLELPARGDIMELDDLRDMGWSYTRCQFQTDGDRFQIYRMNGQRCIVKPLEDESLVEIVYVY
jgi:hypothetical protein